MSDQSSLSYASALSDFRHERQMAALQIILARLTRKSVDLYSFGDIAGRLKLAGGSERGLHDIPVDAIIGSVGRYADFTRSFLPRRDSDVERWARVKAQIISNPVGLPPIEVYKIGDVYFVKDGNHRVSVARQLHQKFIQAHVTEINTKIPLTPDVSPDELILKEEYAQFLQNTHFDDLVPDADIQLTVPGLYKRIEEHIQVHRYFMGIELQREISPDEAVRDWYDQVYLPVVQAIRDRGVLREFPGRTEADLYIWLSEHRYLLERELGWHIRSDVAAANMVNQLSPKAGRIFQRLRRRIIDKLLPDELEDNPTPGDWMEQVRPDQACIFKDILVPISGEEVGWTALEQGILLARCGETRLHGLHAVPSEDQAVSQAAQEIQARFDTRCREANVAGNLALVVGEVSRQIIDRALLTDLVVLNLAHPPASQVLVRMGSGFRLVIRRCARPILAVPGQISPMDRLLLAYDGSVKAKEALFISAYLAGRWSAPLTVVSVPDNNPISRRAIKSAQQYLDSRQVKADYVEERGVVGDVILRVGRERGTNLILMGGYGFSPMLEAVLGSSVDQVLRESEVPILICQ